MMWLWLAAAVVLPYWNSRSPQSLRPHAPRDGPGRRIRGWGQEARIFFFSLFPTAHATTLSQHQALAIANDIELFAACVQSGLSPTQAAEALAQVSKLPEWAKVSALARTGMPASSAWAPMRQEPGWEELAGLIALSEQSGSAIAAGCVRISRSLYTHAADAATARAERAGVLIALPLALCFLPAFIVLGLVPILVSLGGQVLP